MDLGKIRMHLAYIATNYKFNTAGGKLVTN